MKKLILAASIMAASFATQASTEKLEMCKAISGLAEQVMSSRQAGVDMSEMYELSKNSKLGQSIIMMAFEKPMYGTEKYKQREVSNFKNLWFKECMKHEK